MPADDNGEGYTTRYSLAVRNPKEKLARARQATRNLLLDGLSRLSRPRDERFLRCLYCHYVFDDQKERFRQILLSIQKTGTFVDTSTCLSMLAGETKIDGRYFHLSFDDGFRSIFQNAAPVMRDLSVPALIFVPTSIIGADYQSSKEFSRRLKYAGILEMMTWDDLRELRSQGFDIGSHTRTHRRLSELNADESLLREEIIGSKLDLEDNLGAECKYISWPYGRRVDVDDASLRLIRQSGYTACFGAFRGGIYEDRRPDSFSVPRHHFEVQWPMRHINYFARGGREG